MKFLNQNNILHQQPSPLPSDENRPPNLSLPSSDKITASYHPEEENYRQEVEGYVLSNSHPPEEPVNYFQQQPDLSQHMRGVLLCWLMEVHQKYKLSSETFFLTVSIIDEFLKKESVSRNKLQLVGVTALWIASKYHETYQVPKLKNLELLCDHAYRGQDILVMEGQIIQTIGFSLLTKPSALHHFELLKHHAELTPRDYWLARYLLEASIFQLSLQRFSPALLAFSLIFFLKKMRSYSTFEESKLRDLVGGSDHEIRVISRELCSIWHRAEQQDYLAPLRSKYAQKQYHQVSKIRLTERSK